ncbi:MAG TPA: S8 family serine peptidase, partial [Thermoleophilaceae bacterium]|nr:S8 family serine peptidase [Thermoleophilaceae bacterium]
PVRLALARTGAAVRPVEPIGVLAVRARSVAAVARLLSGDPRVAYVERDPALTAADVFDVVDPATAIPFTWAYDEVRAGAALAAAGGGSSHAVAVIDTGIDEGHPDLAGRIDAGFDTASGSSVVTDLVGHGTFVSGLISAVDGNGLGGRGVAGNTKIVPVRASLDRRFSLGDVLEGMDYVIRSGADVVNLSVAGPGFTRSQGRSLALAFLNDVLPVAASGNSGMEESTLEFPAAALGGYRGGDGIGLSVAATRPDGRPAEFSTHNDFVSVAAPGADQKGCAEGVFSTIPRVAFGTLWDDADSCSRIFSEVAGRWAYGEGTSFSAPLAAGIAALVWQVEPELASEQVADVLVRSARQTLPGPRWNEFTGSGTVDGRAATALARIYDTRPPPARGRARRRGRRSIAVTMRRVRDRSERGHERAGNVNYAVLVSRDGGRSYELAARPRTGPFTQVLPLRGPRRHLFAASVCDGNGNCSSRRLGSFRAR